MFRARPILFTLGVLLLLMGSWFFWRNSQIVLSDEQQITNNLEDLRQAVQDQSSSRIADYLAEDFNWSGQSKSELRRQMNGAFIQFRDVTANISGVVISMSGETATATGIYAYSYRPAPRAGFESSRGQFKLQLAKRDGEWLIVKAEDGSTQEQNSGSDGI